MDTLETRNLIENLIALNIIGRKDNPSKGSDDSSLYYVLVIEAPNIELIEDLDELIDDFIEDKFGYLN